MMCLTEGKHRGTGEATWDQITVWLQRKKPRAESRKIHQATWPRQRKAVERDERMETSSSRSSFLIVFLLLLTPPSPFPPSSQGKVRPSGVCSPISSPPSQHHLGIHAPNGVSRCSRHSGVCVILDLLLQFWCPVSQPWHWTRIKTSHSTAESTRISARGKPDAGRDDWAFITGVHTSRTILQTVTDVLKNLRGLTPHFHTAFI